MRSSKRPRNKPVDIAVSGAASGHFGKTLEVHQVESVQSWTGPLPPPAALEAFRELLPDAPERIFRQWEMESDHRRQYESRALRGTIANDRISRLAAAVFALSALGVAAYAISVNQPWVAGVIGGTTIASVVGAFLYGRHSARQK